MTSLFNFKRNTLSVFNRIKKRDNSKIWLLISAIFIALGSIGHLLIIPLVNDHIYNIQERLDNISTFIRYEETNLEQHSEQQLKIATTYTGYLILWDLNRTKAEVLEDDLKQELYQGIETLRGKKIEQIEILALKELTIHELEKIEYSEWNKTIRRRNELFNQSNILTNDIRNKLRKRDWWSIFFGTIQAIGLLVGVYSQYFETKTNKNKT